MNQDFNMYSKETRMDEHRKSIRELVNLKKITSSPLLPQLRKVTQERKCVSLGELESIPVVYFRDEAILLDRKIESGAYSDIYKAYVILNGEKTKIAVKILRNMNSSWSNIKNMSGEKKILLELPKSPYIVNCLGVVTIINEQVLSTNNPINIAGFVLEYCPYHDLHRVLKEGGINLPVSLLKEWIGHAIMAIHFLHKQEPPIVHRDIKSSNFLVNKDLVLKLCDFALSREFTPFNRSTTLERIRSTLIWAPPELFLFKIYSLESDIFSLGIVIWEIVYFWTHNNKYNLPYNISSIWHMTEMYSTDQEKRPPIDGIPEKWLHLIRACWAFNIDERVTIEQTLELYNNILKQE